MVKTSTGTGAGAGASTRHPTVLAKVDMMLVPDIALRVGVSGAPSSVLFRAGQDANAPEVLDSVSRTSEDLLRTLEALLRKPPFAPPTEVVSLEQLEALRHNLTAGGAGGTGGGTAAPSGASRVKRCSTQEEWYDALLGAEGLVVADFGAEWCGACQQVAPLYAQLSMLPKFASVTFLYIDADENPVVIGDNIVSAFPTFKFFRHSEEQDLPIVGGDMRELEEKIDELLATIR